MADSSEIREEGDDPNAAPQNPTQPPTDQPGGEPQAEQLTTEQVVTAMATEMRRLRIKIDTLETNAATAFNGVQQQAGQAQGMASEAAELAFHAQRAKNGSVRIPQPQKFRGVREGPKVLEWTHQAETYLRAAGLYDDPQGVWHISTFFEDDAAVWWRLQCDKIKKRILAAPKNWEELAKVLIAQFQIFNHETSIRDRYTALRQTTSVSSYITRFRELVVELPGETEAQQVYQFLKGLKPEIQARTRTHKPTTLNLAMDIADEADRANYHAYRGSSRPTTQMTSAATRFGANLGRPRSGVQPMDVGTVRQQSRNTDQGHDETNARISTVTPAQPHELQRLRQENRCFYCRKHGHLARDCPKKKKADSRRPRRRQTGNRFSSEN